MPIDFFLKKLRTNDNYLKNVFILSICLTGCETKNQNSILFCSMCVWLFSDIVFPYVTSYKKVFLYFILQKHENHNFLKN